MKKLTEKGWLRALSAVLFAVLVLIGTAASCLVYYGRDNNWYSMSEDGGFEDTAACLVYVDDGLWYVRQNVIWLEDLTRETLGSYAGPGFSYVIRDAWGNITADTRTGKSVYVDGLDGQISYNTDDGSDASGEINDGPAPYTQNFTVAGYVNLPAVPHDGCYAEYRLFTLFFPLRYVLVAAEVLALVLAIPPLLVLLFAAAGQGRAGKLRRWRQMPFDLAAAAALLLIWLDSTAIYPLVDRFTTWLSRYAGTYPSQWSWRLAEGGNQVFLAIWIALALWYMAGQLGAGILRENLWFRRFFRREPPWVGVTAAVAAHAAVLIVVYRWSWLRGMPLPRTAFLLAAVDAAILPALLVYARQAQRIQKAAGELAAGNLTYKTDTAKLQFLWHGLGEDLNRIGDGMAQAVEERMKSERMKTELITNVSHDLKTPITSIVNYVDFLKSENLDSETRAEYLAILDRQSAKLKKLTEDVVEASKAASGALTAHYEPIDAVELLEQFVGEYSERLEAAEVTPVLSVPEGKTLLWADSALLGRVIENLITNILKYAQPGTRAYFDLTRREADAVITVKNVSREPLNISAEELMERFVRGDSSRHSEGSGLGLSIARSLTELMGGRLELVLDGDLFKAVLTFRLAETAEEPPALEE